MVLKHTALFILLCLLATVYNESGTDQSGVQCLANCSEKHDNLVPAKEGGQQSLDRHSAECPDSDIIRQTSNLSLDYVCVGGNIYTNVTKRWEPRISATWGWLAIAIPTLYAAVMLVVVMVVNRKQVSVQEIKHTYNDNKLLIYFLEYCGQELYELITATPDTAHPHYNIFNKPDDYRYAVRWQEDGLHVYGEEVVDGAWELVAKGRVCDTQPGKKFEWVVVTADSLKKAHQPFCKCIKLPKLARLVGAVLTLICMPLVKVLWDVVDVGADTYYFTQLETGTLISKVIARNVHVNNVILTFAIMGCLKSTVLGLGYSTVVRFNTGGSDCASIFLKPVLVCIKILFEDGVELIAEYYYGDKFVTTDQPWWLILKDLITAILYVVPLVTIVRSFKKNCAEVRKPDYFTMLNTRIHVFRWVHVYVLCVVVHFTFSIATLARVGGMAWQYSGAIIKRECLEVNDGYLKQTPFAEGCLNVFDYIIIVCMSIIFVVLSVIIFFVVLHRFNKNVSEYLCDKYDKTCKYVSDIFTWVHCKTVGCFRCSGTRFDIDGSVTTSARVSRRDTLDYVSYTRVEEHFHPPRTDMISSEV